MRAKRQKGDGAAKAETEASTFQDMPQDMTIRTAQRLMTTTIADRRTYHIKYQHLKTTLAEVLNVYIPLSLHGFKTLM